MKRRSHRSESAGFTLIEVVVAAGLLASFAVYTARPIQQAILGAAVAADKAAAVYYAENRLEWAKSLQLWYYDNGGEYNFGIGTGSEDNKFHFFDSARGMDFAAQTRKVSIQTATVSGSSKTVLWRVESIVQWTRGGRANLVKVYTYQSRWMASDVANGTGP